MNNFRTTNEDFFQYLQDLSVGELKGLNYRLELNPMALSYGIGADSYIVYLHEVNRKGNQLAISKSVDSPYFDEDGFLYNDLKMWSYSSAKKIYQSKGGHLNFNEAKEYRDRSF